MVGLKRRYRGGYHLGKRGVKVKTYADYLRNSNYSQALKDFYFKNQYRYVHIPEHLYNSNSFIENIKDNYQKYLNE